jgi:hypothetical protein
MRPVQPLLKFGAMQGTKVPFIMAAPAPSVGSTRPPPRIMLQAIGERKPLPGSTTARCAGRAKWRAAANGPTSPARPGPARPGPARTEAPARYQMETCTDRGDSLSLCSESLSAPRPLASEPRIPPGPAGGVGGGERSRERGVGAGARGTGSEGATV